MPTSLETCFTVLDNDSATPTLKGDSSVMSAYKGVQDGTYSEALEVYSPMVSAA